MAAAWDRWAGITRTRIPSGVIVQMARAALLRSRPSHHTVRPAPGAEKECA